MILQDLVKGGRIQGGLYYKGVKGKGLKKNIKEWTRLQFGKSQRTLENMAKWRRLVVKSHVVHQQP